MNDGPNAAHGFREVRRLLEVLDLDELEPVLVFRARIDHRLPLCEGARRAAHREPTRQEVVYDVGADEAGGTGNKDGFPSQCSCQLKILRSVQVGHFPLRKGVEPTILSPWFRVILSSFVQENDLGLKRETCARVVMARLHRSQ